MGLLFVALSSKEHGLDLGFVLGLFGVFCHLSGKLLNKPFMFSKQLQMRVVHLPCCCTTRLCDVKSSVDFSRAVTQSLRFCEVTVVCDSIVFPSSSVAQAATVVCPGWRSSIQAAVTGFMGRADSGRMVMASLGKQSCEKTRG